MRNSRKLVWFSHFVPYPPRGGSFQRSFHLLRHVARDFEVHLVAFNMHRANPTQLEEYRRALGQFCAQVDFWELPVAWRSAAWWARLGFSPFFHAPYTCHSLWSRELDDSWKRLLEQAQPSLVHFDSIDLGLYFFEHPAWRLVLNHHNCESAMIARRAEKEGNPLARIYLRHQAGKLQRLEKELCHRFHCNVAVSEQDRRHLLSLDPRAHVHVVENGTDTDYLAPVPGAEEPDSLVFAGSLRWYPNLSGLEFFLNQVWPLLKQQRPQLRLCLAGRDPSDSFIRWAQRDPSITVVPNPEDIRPSVARGWVFICPILDGGGTRLKILDALAMGKAVVSTTIGCEGLQVTPGQNILVADSPRNFAAEVLRVLDSPELRRHLGQAGRALVERQYNWSALAAQLRQAYTCALEPASCPQLAPATAKAGKS
jgi:glycosyltransferase involved in cell wall biosynthesis